MLRDYSRRTDFSGYSRLPPSIIGRKHHGSHRTVPLGDDVEAVSCGCAVATEDARSAAQGGFVRLAVLLAEFISPVAAAVTSEVASKINIERNGTGRGEDAPAGRTRPSSFRRGGWSKFIAE
jgi:hypothetical protein